MIFFCVFIFSFFLAEEKENHFSFNIRIPLFYYFTTLNIFLLVWTWYSYSNLSYRTPQAGTFSSFLRLLCFERTFLFLAMNSKQSALIGLLWKWFFGTNKNMRALLDLRVNNFALLYTICVDYLMHYLKCLGKLYKYILKVL